MAITHNQDGPTTTESAGAATSVTTDALSSPLQLGDLVSVQIEIQGSGGVNRSVSTVVDSLGNAYTLDVAGTSDAAHNNVEIWSCKGVTVVGSPTHTVTMSGAALIGVQRTVARAGAGTWAVDASSGGTAAINATQPSTGAFTTIAANTFIVGAFADTSITSVTSPTSFAQIGLCLAGGTGMGGQSAWMIATTPLVAINPTWSSLAPSGSGQWVSVGVAYKFIPAAAGGSFMGADMVPVYHN